MKRLRPTPRRNNDTERPPRPPPPMPPWQRVVATPPIRRRALPLPRDPGSCAGRGRTPPVGECTSPNTPPPSSPLPYPAPLTRPSLVCPAPPHPKQAACTLAQTPVAARRARRGGGVDCFARSRRPRWSGVRAPPHGAPVTALAGRAAGRRGVADSTAVPLPDGRSGYATAPVWLWGHRHQNRFGWTGGRGWGRSTTRGRGEAQPGRPPPLDAWLGYQTDGGGPAAARLGSPPAGPAGDRGQLTVGSTTVRVPRPPSRERPCGERGVGGGGGWAGF